MKTPSNPELKTMEYHVYKSYVSALELAKVQRQNCSGCGRMVLFNSSYVKVTEHYDDGLKAWTHVFHDFECVAGWILKGGLIQLAVRTFGR